jgi:hypothetical protein
VEIFIRFFKISELRLGGVWNPTFRYATVIIYIFPKLLTTKCIQCIVNTLKDPVFENKVGRSLSQDSQYLPLQETMCSTKNPFCGDQTATALKYSTIHQKGNLMWELTKWCWYPTYYLWLNHRLWCVLWNSNRPTCKHFPNLNIYLYTHTQNTAQLIQRILGIIQRFLQTLLKAIFIQKRPATNPGFFIEETNFYKKATATNATGSFTQPVGLLYYPMF